MNVFKKLNKLSKKGCRVNQTSLSNLFSLYENSGFLYPEKKQRISPFIPNIYSNWEKALTAGEDLLWIVTNEKPKNSITASLSVWRSTQNGLVAQHLASMGNPEGVFDMMLFAQCKVIIKGRRSTQNWFSSGNKYAGKIFATAPEYIGAENSCLNTWHYLDMPKHKAFPKKNSISVIRCDNDNPYGIFDFTTKIRGQIYASGEELDTPDIELREVDALYRKVGLSRKRMIWMAYHPNVSDGPAGAVIVYRGPLGLNFSFIENRCDLLASSSLNDDMLENVCIALMQKAQAAYQDFEPPFFPVSTDERCAAVLLKMGAKFVRKYKQSIWLKDGYIDWYRHIEKFAGRLKRRRLRLSQKATHTLENRP